MNSGKLFQIFFSFILIAAVAGNIFPLGLHNYHTSLTRIDYNAKEKLIEISVNLFTHDLVPTLELQTGKSIDLEKTPDIDKIIFDFLNKNFVLKDRNGEVKKLVWVGKEIQIEQVFVFVEVSSVENPDGFSLQNTFFFDSFPEQINRVIARYNDKKTDLLFKVGDKFKEIKLPGSTKRKLKEVRKFFFLPLKNGVSERNEGWFSCDLLTIP
jgi:hypothetical protein